MVSALSAPARSVRAPGKGETDGEAGEGTF